MKKAIFSDKATSAIFPYSHAVVCGDTVYLSGQIPLDPKTMELCSGNIKEQVEQVFANIKNVCIAAGGSLKDLVKLTIYLIDLAHFPVVNAVMEECFEAPYPARVTIAVSQLPKNSLVEIDAIMRLTL